jgi:hypothetical protein
MGGRGGARRRGAGAAAVVFGFPWLPHRPTRETRSEADAFAILCGSLT